jgi:hypothetical protein
VIIYDAWGQHGWIEPQRPATLPGARSAIMQCDNSWGGGLWAQAKGEAKGTPDIGTFNRVEIGRAIEAVADDGLLVNDSEGSGIGFDWGQTPAEVTRRKRKHTDYLKIVYSINPKVRTAVFAPGGYDFDWFSGSAYDENQRALESACDYLFAKGRYHAAAVPLYIESTDPIGSLMRHVDHVARIRALGVPCIPTISLMEWNGETPVKPLEDDMIRHLLDLCRTTGCEGVVRWESPDLPYTAEYAAAEAVMLGIAGGN